ncbi:hypothetical protein Fcan01_18109 [Folsomia candida]|uniref:Uncharacterized protein n=1 Tax=Folsomia candida TaxID=158441 RepID=A0A226DS40_FOLCA|nr:hypothetical protein Fcan01_18109 [Folsomia candida]
MNISREIWCEGRNNSFNQIQLSGTANLHIREGVLFEKYTDCECTTVIVYGENVTLTNVECSYSIKIFPSSSNTSVKNCRAKYQGRYPLQQQRPGELQQVHPEGQQHTSPPLQTQRFSPKSNSSVCDSMTGTVFANLSSVRCSPSESNPAFSLAPSKKKSQQPRKSCVSFSQSIYLVVTCTRNTGNGEKEKFSSKKSSGYSGGCGKTGSAKLYVPSTYIGGFRRHGYEFRHRFGHIVLPRGTHCVQGFGNQAIPCIYGIYGVYGVYGRHAFSP